MRILGIGEDHCLGDLYRRLGMEGHQVRVHVACPESHGVMAGLVTRCEDWRAELDWVRAAGDDGVLVFETACHGEIQDQLRRDGFQVIGGSAWGDRLEADRDYGQQVLRELGLRTAKTHSFDSFEQAVAFVQQRPARYVYKLCDSHAASTRNYVGQLEDGADVIGMLRMEARALAVVAQPCFVLMDHVSGVEVGVGAYFDGQAFLQPACLDWEHKHFFPGDLGELTGEMGTVVTYRGAGRLFEQTLAQIAEPLRESGYCGYINLNTIINEDGIWPLELTCRFGYPGYSICAALHRETWATVFRKMLRQLPGPIATRAGFSVGVVLAVPPFPYLQPACGDSPVFFRQVLSADEREHLHFAEIAMIDGQLMVSGCQGYAMVATGIGDDVVGARDAAYSLVRKLVIPNLRYRNDIGDRLARKGLSRLAALGYEGIGTDSARR
ncbi:MAG: phosphoribosylamine--glycine ligase [Panacagrimonas sp.]